MYRPPTQILRHTVHEGAHQPQRIGKREGGVGQHEAEQRVRQPERHHHQIERDDQHH